MRIVVAMDSFKRSATAEEACAAVARGISSEISSVDLLLRPMADGGEGTAETLLAATHGEWIPADVAGPLPGLTVSAGFAWLPDRGPGALVEMAKASGLELLRPDQLDPLRATTIGTGELLAAACERGARTVWLGIGGSATVDGGTGAAHALGWRFLDGAGDGVEPGGAGLERISRVVRPESPLYRDAQIEVLCDVDNPLVGPRGAARVFGPQKGATPDLVERLEAGLSNLADVIERDLGKEVRAVRGAGAAGGLGAGAIAFLDAALVSGVEAIMDASGLDEALEGAAWVITGEGRLDGQSLEGKVVSGVARRARDAGCGVAVLAGAVALDAGAALEAGISVVEAASPEDMPLEEALARGTELIEAAASRLARALSRLGP